jgi:hypothetical protein
VLLEKALLLKARAIADGRKQRMFVLATLPEPSGKELKDFCDRNRITLVMVPWVITPRTLSSANMTDTGIPAGIGLSRAHS